MDEQQHEERQGNLGLWNSVCTTDPEHTKKVNTRGGFTAIDATYQLREATRQLGVYGNQWGLRSLAWGLIESDGKATMTLDAEFWGPEISFPVSVDMLFKHNDDCRKKLLTSARSKALALLGFNADVFLGRYDDDAYVCDMRSKYEDEDEMREKVFRAIRTARSAGALKTCRERLDELRGKDALNKTIYDEGLQLIEEHGRGLTNGVV